MRTPLAVLCLLTLTPALGRSDAAMQARGGVELVAVTSSVEGALLVLEDRKGTEVGSGITDRFGSYLFTEVVNELGLSRVVLPVVPGVEPPSQLPACPGLRGQPCRTYMPAANGGRARRDRSPSSSRPTRPGARGDRAAMAIPRFCVFPTVMDPSLAVCTSGAWPGPMPPWYPWPRVPHDAPSTIDETRAFAAACANGDPAARRAFLDRFAEDVYNFPVKIYGVPADQAADFYLYAFERDRIFARLRSFEGRNAIQLRTFLAYYVLRGLFLDWQRGRHELETVSLDVGPAAEDAPPLGARLAATAPEDLQPVAVDAGTMGQLWAELTPEERLDLKLLSLLEHDLDAGEVRLLSRMAGRPLAETRALVDEVQAALRAKDVRLAALARALDSTWGWLVLRRRELHDVDQQLTDLGEASTAATERLRARRRTLEASIAKRTQQRARLLEQIRSFKVTTPYKDIARLKGSTVGTVCSRIFRLRERLTARLPAAEDRQ